MEPYKMLKILRLSDVDKLEFLRNPDITLDSFDTVEIVKSLTNDKLKLEFLRNLRTTLKSIDISEIFLSFTDNNKLEFLRNPSITVDLFCIAEILISLADIRKLLFLRDTSVILDLPIKILFICSLQTDNNRFFKSYGLMANKSYKKTIGLPSNMTIGVELEAEGSYAEGLMYMGKVLNRWETKHDGSLDNGVEVTSPILRDTEEDMYQLATVCTIMQKLNLHTSQNTGRSYTFWC